MRVPNGLTGGIGGRESVRALLVFGLILTVAVGPAAADHADCSTMSGDDKQECQQQHLQGQMETVGNFLALVIGAVAIPNGAFGIFQWMTAGTDTEQSDKGRKRIRNSFIGVGGAGAVMLAVRLLTTMVGV